MPIDGKKINRDQIAELANVSSATVSRVFNSPDKVKEETRKKVLAVSRELGYSPNLFASVLRRNGSGQITLLEISKKRPYHWSNVPFYSWHYYEVIKSIKKSMRDSNYLLNILFVEGTEEVPKALNKYKCDGIIAHDIEDEQEAQMIASLGIPYVLCFHTSHFEGLNRCYVDNFAGGSLAGRLLSKTGHSKPAYITSGIHGTQKSPVHADRYQGFISVFADGDIRIIDTPDIHDEKTWGMDACRSLLPDIKAGLIDSIGVVNDLTAVGVVQCLMEHNLRIPDDISVVSNDNLPLITVLPIELATVDFQVGLVYKIAIEELLATLETGDNIDRCISPVLIEGRSVSSGH